jgi:hypothetical protein
VMSAAKSGWVRPPVVCEIFDLVADIRKRLDGIEAEACRRQQVKEASDAMRGATKE